MLFDSALLITIVHLIVSVLFVHIKQYLLLVLTIISWFMFNYYFKPNKSNIETFNNSPNDNVDIIVSRYNETLDWMHEFPFNKYKYIVYNKGPNDNFNKDFVKQVIKLDNVGRESHTYLHHIINNYNNLGRTTVFLPGSINTTNKKYNKKFIAKKLLSIMNKINRAIFIAYPSNVDLKTRFHDFELKEYLLTSDENKQINNDSSMELSECRPYHRWYDKYFGDKVSDVMIHFGIFSIDRKDILQHPIEYYQTLINQLSSSSNPEVGHYFERSWGVIFGPLTETVVIYDKEI